MYLRRAAWQNSEPRGLSGSLFATKLLGGMACHGAAPNLVDVAASAVRLLRYAYFGCVDDLGRFQSGISDHQSPGHIWLGVRECKTGGPQCVGIELGEWPLHLQVKVRVIRRSTSRSMVDNTCAVLCNSKTNRTSCRNKELGGTRPLVFRRL